VADAAGKTWQPVNNVGQALDDVVVGRNKWPIVRSN
jgi:hypothetical protein